MTHLLHFEHNINTKNFETYNFEHNKNTNINTKNFPVAIIVIINRLWETLIDFGSKNGPISLFWSFYLLNYSYKPLFTDWDLEQFNKNLLLTVITRLDKNSKVFNLFGSKNDPFRFTPTIGCSKSLNMKIKAEYFLQKALKGWRKLPCPCEFSFFCCLCCLNY